MNNYEVSREDLISEIKRDLEVGKSLTNPAGGNSRVSLSEAVKEACKQPTLLDALSWIAVWESERVIQQARKFYETGVSTASDGKGWDTCFRVCFKLVMEAYSRKT